MATWNGHLLTGKQQKQLRQQAARRIAPRESWWIGKDRTDFQAEVHRREAQRLRHFAHSHGKPNY